MATTQSQAEEAGEVGHDFVFKLQPKHKAAIRNYCVSISFHTF